MRHNRFWPGLLFLLLAAHTAHADSVWSTIPTPVKDSPKVIGGYANGCIIGAKDMPLTGDGWQVMKPSRNRFWGHPNLINFLTDFAGKTKKETGKDILLGDLSQPRGGPMAYGHASHETGLDVDIWFEQPATGRIYETDERNEKNMKSLLFPGTLKIIPELWKDEYATLLKLAAEYDEVERIFVNAAIKDKLCETYAGEKWMRKVRPWRKHDDHFHVRLKCPAGNVDCIPQPLPPPGDGCDDSLKWWFSTEGLAALFGPKPPKAKEDDKTLPLPIKCDGLLKR